MKKQYILLTILVCLVTKLTATPTKKEEKKDETGISTPVFFDDIEWNPQKKFDNVVTAKVPDLETSILSSLAPYTYPSIIEKITPLTLEQLDTNKTPDFRRKVSRAVIEMIREIHGFIEQHKDNVPVLLKTVHPKILQLRTFSLKAKYLNLLDAQLDEQVPAWIMKYDGYVTEFDKQNFTVAENYRKDIVLVWKDFGFTNDCNRALFTLTNLNPLAVKQNGPLIQAKANDFLATLVAKLNNSKSESTELVQQIYDVLELATVKGITLDRHQLDVTKKALRQHQTNVIAPELQNAVVHKLQAAKKLKDVEKKVRMIYDDTYKASTPDDNNSDDEYEINDSDSSTWTKLTTHLLKKNQKKVESEQQN